MEKVIKVCDLFQVYFIWDSYFYIELLRPLEERDFTVLSTTDNSIRFISDNDWSFNLDYKLNSCGSRSNLVIKAHYAIVFNYKEELESCIRANIKEVDNKQLMDMFANLYNKYTATLHVNYNYGGCVNKESRDKKDAKALKELKDIVLGDRGKNKVSSLYSSTIEKINQKFGYYNTEYYDKVRYAIRDDIEFHNSIRSKYSDESKKLVDEIENRREKIKELEKEIEKLVVVVGEEHKEIMSKEISEMSYIPSSVKDTALVDVKNLRVFKESDRHFPLFSGEGGILIRKV